MNISPSLTTMVFLKEYHVCSDNCLKLSIHIYNNCENFFSLSLQINRNQKLKMKGIRCSVKHQFYIKHVILLACVSEKSAQTKKLSSSGNPDYPATQSGAK